jgi:DNA-binding transcriptional LysR family regulator
MKFIVLIYIINYIDNMRITFKQIEVFVAVAKTGNMTQAASALHLTQSACSMALSAIETQLGGVLFDRHGKKLFLNERGRMLFPKAVNIIVQIKELRDLMMGKKEGTLAGHLIVGASTTIGNYLLPKMIGDFITVYPKTKITLSVANTEQIIQKLLKFDIDIGMIEGNCYSDALEVIPWKKDQLIVIASAKHPLAKKRKITPACLRNAKWILRESGSGTREKFEEAMGHKINPFLEFGHTEAIKHAVLTDLGISCLSKTAVSDLLNAGELIELKTPFLKLTRDFYILLHKEKHRTVLLNQFIALLK